MSHFLSTCLYRNMVRFWNTLVTEPFFKECKTAEPNLKLAWGRHKPLEYSDRLFQFLWKFNFKFAGFLFRLATRSVPTRHEVFSQSRWHKRTLTKNMDFTYIYKSKGCFQRKYMGWSSSLEACTILRLIRIRGHP